MSDETLVFQMEELFVRVNGKRITALPETGTIASVERINARGVLTSGLFGTGAFNFIKSKAYRVTVNVFPRSKDDAFMKAGADLGASQGRPSGISVTHKGLTYVSGSVILTADPVRNFISDSTEVLAYVYEGLFTLASVTSFIAPKTLTQAEVDAAVPAPA